MNYVKFGAGKKTFVIIPGLSVHSVTGIADGIAAAYKDFADEYTVYLFDRADNIRDGYTVREMAADTAAAMRELGIEKADIFGASQGGMISLYLAADFPELVRSIAVGSSLAAPNENFRKVISEWVNLAEKKDERGLIESFIDNVYSKKTLDLYRESLISSNLGITDKEYERFIILARACLTFDCRSELRKIKCPVLVIGAEGDRVTTADRSRELAALLPECECYIYGGEYGHGVYDEAPDYKKRLLEFFGR